jgi:hypothetical protein
MRRFAVAFPDESVGTVADEIALEIVYPEPDAPEVEPDPEG